VGRHATPLPHWNIRDIQPEQALCQHSDPPLLGEIICIQPGLAQILETRACGPARSPALSVPAKILVGGRGVTA